MIRWIGWDIDLNREKHPVKKVPIDGQSKSFMFNQSQYKFSHYGLTTTGDGLTINTDQLITSTDGLTTKHF